MKHLREVWNKEIIIKKKTHESRNTKEKQMSQTKLVSEKMSYVFRADESRNRAILASPSIHCSSVTQLCPTLCDRTPGFPVLHCLLEFAQTHVHWVSDAIQPSHSLSSPSPSCLQSFPASGSFPMSQLFKSGGQSIGPSASASVLPMNIQG